MITRETAEDPYDDEPRTAAPATPAEWRSLIGEWEEIRHGHHLGDTRARVLECARHLRASVAAGGPDTALWTFGLLLTGPYVLYARPDAAAEARVGWVTLADVERLDLRVAEVLAAEPVPGATRLLKLTVSLGTESRTIVAGIAQHYRPADLTGRKIVVVANLQPARLMGVESQGMLLAGTAGDRLALVTVDGDLPAGARVR